jgi:putative transposase
VFFPDELYIHAQGRAAWMPQGSQQEVTTLGQNEKHYLAGALELTTGKILHYLGPRKNKLWTPPAETRLFIAHHRL